MRFFLFPLLFLLAACGFQPLYGDVTDDNAEIASYLAAITVDAEGGVMAQQLQNELEDRLNPSTRGSVFGDGRFILKLQVSSDRDPVLVELDGNILRYHIELVSRFELLEGESGKRLHRGVVRRTASFNVVDEKFAAYVAEKDAIERALVEMSQDYKMRLGAYFAENGGPLS